MPLLEEAYAEAAPLMERDPGHGGGHSGEVLAPSAGGGVLPVWACDAMLMSRASVMSKQTNYHIKKVGALLLLLLVSSIAVVGLAFLVSLLVAPSGAARNGTTAGPQHPAVRARLGRAFSTSASNSSAMSTVTAMDELSFVDLRTTKTARTSVGGDDGQSKTISTAQQDMKAAAGNYEAVQMVYRGLQPADLKSNVNVLATLFHFGTDPVDARGPFGVCTTVLPHWSDNQWTDPPVPSIVPATVATKYFSPDSCTVQPPSKVLLGALGATMISFNNLKDSDGKCFPSICATAGRLLMVLLKRFGADATDFMLEGRRHDAEMCR